MTQDALNESTASYSKWSTDGDSEHAGINQCEERDPEQVDIHYSNKRYELTGLQKFLFGRKGIALLVLVLLIVFVFGAVMGHLIKVPEPKPQHVINPTPTPGHSKEDNKTSYQTAGPPPKLGDISRIELENNLKFFTEKPRMASSAENEKVADYIVSKWADEFDFAVETKSYQVLLSCQPNYFTPNTVSIVSETGEGTPVVIKSQAEFLDLDHPFNAYSKVGTAKGLPLYVNYGTEEDFETIDKMIGSERVKGTVVIMRYGKIFRGDKVKNAIAAGAVAAILYTDPADYSDPFVNGEALALPSNGTQRGNIRSGYGDPLTPGMPATDDAYRVSESLADLPSIPVISISADAARTLMFDGLSHLDFPEIEWDNHWLGGLKRRDDGSLESYFLGPGYIDHVHLVEVTVNNQPCNRTIRNLVATIPGDVEPDRYVLVGNHRDSWTYGATDPASGTAVLMELSRALSDLLQQGWKPRRTIMLISWDAEEFGMIGSSEWVEENQRVLEEGAVVYLNLDAVVVGNHSFSASASPLLSKLIYEATGKVSCPTHGDTPMTVYDDWKEKTAATEHPNVGYLGSGSDHHAFAQIVGVPSVDMFYSNHPNIKDQVLYPTYHTGFDTFANLKANVDQDFGVHEAMTRIAAEMVLQLSDDTILPIDCRDYLKTFQEGLAELDDIKQNVDKVQLLHDSITKIESAVEAFRKSAELFEEEINTSDLENPLIVRSINDRKSKLERTFISRTELPNSKQDRHLVYAPGKSNQYSANLFPALVSAIEAATKGGENQHWEEVKKQSAILTLSIRAAAKTLQSSFKG